jgi:cytochrome P450
MLKHLQKVQDSTQSVIDGTFKYSQDQLDLGIDRTIIHELLESDLPAAEKSHSRLWQEGQIVIGAGADTTANTLTVTHFYVLDNPEVKRKLEAELIEALPDKYAPVKLNVVEKLPYLVSSGMNLYFS